MKFILALTVIVGVFFIAQNFIGTVWAIGLSVLALLVFWAISNYRESTQGLIRANLKTYFMARSKEYSHVEAMNTMVKSRYPFARDVQETFLVKIDKLGQEDEEAQLKYIVLHIFFHENGMPPLDSNWGIKIDNDFNIIYKTMKQRYQH